MFKDIERKLGPATRVPRQGGHQSYRFLGLGLFGLLLALAVGCTTVRQPVLYPNAHYQIMGQARAHSDVDACMRRAEDFGVSRYDGSGVARSTATGAAVGGAAAGAWGLVRGESAVGNRALGGAAAGGVAGLVRGSLRAGEPSVAYKGFVARCLTDHGYQVIGWQ